MQTKLHNYIDPSLSSIFAILVLIPYESKFKLLYQGKMNEKLSESSLICLSSLFTAISILSK